MLLMKVFPIFFLFTRCINKMTQSSSTRNVHARIAANVIESGEEIDYSTKISSLEAEIASCSAVNDKSGKCRAEMNLAFIKIMKKKYGGN